MAKILRHDHFHITYHDSMPQAEKAAAVWRAEYPKVEIYIIENVKGGPVALWVKRQPDDRGDVDRKGQRS